MEEEKRKMILQEAFEEWMKENRPEGDDEYSASIAMTTDEVKEQLQTIVFCKDDEVAELLYDNHYSKRFFGDHVAWMVRQQGDPDF